MSEPEDQTEPEMEEILASIRRIISEDNPETAPEAVEDEAESELDPEDEVAMGSDAEDVLDLTRVVNEDGSVVDLSADGESSDTLEEPPSEFEPPSEAEQDPAHQPVSDLEAAYASEPDPHPEVEFQPEPDPEPDSESEPDPEPEPDDEPESDPDPQPEPGVEPMSEIPTIAASGGEKSDSPRPAASAMETLISGPTIATATTLLADAVKTITSESSGDQKDLIGGNRTLENVVREALLPELKAWLDANLATLVERVVREEVRKMVRRAENQ